MVPEEKLRTSTPTITQDRAEGVLVLSTEGPRVVRPSTPPAGIVFQDGSFLTLFEEWSIPGGELLQYSYHYQQRNLSVRFDMDKTKRKKVPQHHVQTSTLVNKHLPCGGPVDFGEVLDTVVSYLIHRSR